MGQYDLFRVIAQSSLSEKEREVNDIKQNILNDFENSPSFETITISGVSYGVRIVEENSLQKNPNKKRILMKPGDTIAVGDIVTWNGNDWLCTDLDPDNGIYYVGIIERCNNELKWLNDIGGEESTSCIVTNTLGSTSEGTTENKYLITLDYMLQVKIPNDSITANFKEDMRFIFSHKKAYKITSINDLSQEGLMVLSMKSDQINTAIDDKLNNIADAFTNTYAFSIQEDTLSVVIGTPAQLHTTLTKNGTSMTSTLTWSSSDTTIATVDSNGLVTPIKEGTVTITATVQGNPNLTDTATITVSATVQDNITYAIVGNSEIKQGQTVTYIAQKLNNGIVVAGTQFDFTVIPGGTPISVYSLTVVDNQNCTLKCLDYQYNITLRATDRADNTKYIEKIITLRSLL